MSGVHGNEDSRHVTQLSKLALQLMLAVQNLSKKEVGGANVQPQVRVGLHTGGERKARAGVVQNCMQVKSHKLRMCLEIRRVKTTVLLILGHFPCPP